MLRPLTTACCILVATISSAQNTDSLPTNDTVQKVKFNIIAGIQWSFAYDAQSSYANDRYKTSGQVESKFSYIPFPTIGIQIKKWFVFLDGSYKPYTYTSNTEDFKYAYGHSQGSIQLNYNFIKDSVVILKPIVSVKTGFTQKKRYGFSGYGDSGSYQIFQREFEENADIITLSIAAGAQITYKRLYIHALIGFCPFIYYSGTYKYLEEERDFWTGQKIITANYTKSISQVATRPDFTTSRLWAQIKAGFYLRKSTRKVKTVNP